LIYASSSSGGGDEDLTDGVIGDMSANNQDEYENKDTDDEDEEEDDKVRLLIQNWNISIIDSKKYCNFLNFQHWFLFI